MHNGNYRGNGKDCKGSDVAVSRGPAGDWLYPWEPFRYEVDRLHAEGLNNDIIQLFCSLNEITIGGFVPAEWNGEITALIAPTKGFLTKPVRVREAE